MSIIQARASPLGFAKQIEAENDIESNIKGYIKAKLAWEKSCNYPLLALKWTNADFNIFKKANLNYFSECHSKVVASKAIQLLKVLISAGVSIGIEQEAKSEDCKYFFDEDDSHVIILLSSLLHNVGRKVLSNRNNVCSMLSALSILDEILKPIYSNENQRSTIRGFIINSIYSNVDGLPSQTIEAGVLKIADMIVTLQENAYQEVVRINKYPSWAKSPAKRRKVVQFVVDSFDTEKRLEECIKSTPLAPFFEVRPCLLIG